MKAKKLNSQDRTALNIYICSNILAFIPLAQKSPYFSPKCIFLPMIWIPQPLIYPAILICYPSLPWILNICFLLTISFQHILSLLLNLSSSKNPFPASTSTSFSSYYSIYKILVSVEVSLISCLNCSFKSLSGLSNFQSMLHPAKRDLKLKGSSVLLPSPSC